MPCCSSPAKLSSPYSAVATLLLIENSSSMSTLWHILRDRYLPSVLRKLEGTTSNFSPSTFFVESSSLSPGITASPQFKVYDGSCGLEFALSDVTSRLSVEKVHSSIDLLNTIAIQTQPIARHLIIVAASAPLPNYQNANPNHPTARSTWLQLAERMTQDNIQCHLILKTDQEASPFEILFQETLRLRTSREAHLPFNVQPAEAIIRLTETIDFAQSTAAQAYSQRSHQRLPLEPSNGKSYDSCYANSSQTQSEMPSLVAQLQQKHGLTKKKVYGVKPPRQPFFRDEPTSDPYRRPVYPLLPPLTDLSSTTPIMMTPGGRSAPLSRLDRWTRMSHRGPTDTSQRWHPPSSKIPSSDVGCSDVPSCMPPNEPTVIHGRHPTIQTPVEMPYQPATNLDQNGFYRPTTYESSIDSQWGTGPSGYVPQNSPIITQTPQAAYVQNVSADTYGHRQTPTSLGSPPASQSPPDHKPSGPACNEAAPLKYDAPASSTSSPSPKAGSTPKDDEPFTFDPAFIAATAVMFRQEVLPAYPELADSYVSPSSSTKRRISGTAQGYNVGCDHSILPYLPASKAGQLYAAKYSVAACQQQTESEANASSLTTSENTTAINAESCYYQYPTYSVGTSSLTGWAG
ncbi:hypothetical protein M378DRAFT_647305 [Amanita muscaria Koide BX008]|uniref:Mediator of RNA polymerase II transcription subunit 25 n=1 Tax=Amanita muscaria (strain Koide BX008) TaxID=946122 RepID=A0A0C2SL23_AMAMK|nr:hypothetical protein M378DRAFT_647305 [Amanita muscaria Koide BX008]